jgi:hypothetical protein
MTDWSIEFTTTAEKDLKKLTIVVEFTKDDEPPRAKSAGYPAKAGRFFSRPSSPWQANRVFGLKNKTISPRRTGGHGSHSQIDSPSRQAPMLVIGEG